MSKLLTRIKALEARFPERKVIFFSWLQQPGTEITKANYGNSHWTRDPSESERNFLERIKEEVALGLDEDIFIFVN